MKQFCLFVFLTSTAFGQGAFVAGPNSHTPVLAQSSIRDSLVREPRLAKLTFRSSQMAFAAATVADVLSSRGRYEVNPVLGTGPFTVANQGARLMGITGGILLAEELLVRKFPKLRKGFGFVNLVGASSHGYATMHNYMGR